MRIIDYTESLPPMAGANIHYRNPKYWSGDAERVDFVHTEDKQILKAYEKAGIPKWPGKVDRPVTPKVTVDPKPIVIPEDWATLAWPKKRALAASLLRDEQVKSKAHAEDIILAAYKEQVGEG